MSYGKWLPLSLSVLCLSLVAMTGSTRASDTIASMADDHFSVEGEMPSLLSESSWPNEITGAEPAAGFGSWLDADRHAPISSPSSDEFLSQWTAAEQQAFLPSTSPQLTGDKRDWVLLPDGLLWHSYLAGPQEPRISAMMFNKDNDGYFCDATLGGRVGFLRYGTPRANNPRGWQWDLEGAVITRMNLEQQQEVESMDYRFGTELTWSEGAWAMKAGYFHISSHVGDEYLLREPKFDRINYVTESLIWGASYKPSQPVRVYGEVAYAVHRSGGARPFQFQTGAEWTLPPRQVRRLAPFAAANLGFFEATDFHMQTTLQAGWYYQGPLSGRRLRFGLQYGDGPTSQFEFFKRSEEYLGVGIWYDY